MIVLTPSLHRFVLASLSLALLMARSAHGGTRDGSPLGLVVFGGELPPDDLRARLERELGRPVVLAESTQPAGPFVTVTWRKERSELAVSYDEPGRGTVSRVVPARALASENVEDAVLLSTSLVRNEADELLGKPAASPLEARPAVAAALEAHPTAPTTPSIDTRQEPDFIPAYASFFHPLATNVERPWATTRFGFNLLYGRAGALEGGAQLGLVNAVVGKPGFASGEMSGVQLAPFFGLNYASGRASGMQIAFFANATGGALEGAQIALGANVASEGVAGAELALGANVAPGAVDGFQVSAVNVAGDLRGAQVGVVNVAAKVDGFMLGLVNVADDVDGVPIGLLSVTRTGGVHPVAWASSATFANVGLKFATKHTYTMVAVDYTTVNGGEYPATASRPVLQLDSRDFVGGGFFIGGRVPVGEAFVDFDASGSAMVATRQSTKVDATSPANRYREFLFEPRLRVMAGYEIARHFAPFVGAGLVVRVRLVNDGDDAVGRVMPELFGGIQF